MSRGPVNAVARLEAKAAGTAPATVLFPYVGGPGSLGGSHISSLKLVQSLQDHDRYRAIVGLHRDGGPMPDLLERMGLAWKMLPVRGMVEQSRWLDGRPSRFRRTRQGVRYACHGLPDMVRFLRARDIAIVHTNDGRMHANWALAALFAHTRHVWHHRAEPEATGVNWVAPLLADRIVTVSRFARPSKPVRPVAHKVRVIHSPFDPPPPFDADEARRRLVTELGCDPGTCLVGVVGSLVDRKRPQDIVDIVAKMRDAAPALSVMGLVFGVALSGGPPLDRTIVARAEQLGVADRVRLMGYRSPIEEYVAALDALIVPAMNEPFGRSLIEAMQLGTPVVANNHGGNPEAIVDGQTGFLVEPGAPEGFVDPILRLMRDRDLRDRIVGAARTHSLAAFSTEHHRRDILKVYDEMAGR